MKVFAINAYKTNIIDKYSFIIDTDIINNNDNR